MGFRKKVKQIINNSKKSSIIVYLVVRTLILLCIVREIMLGNYANAFLCILSLILLLIPAFIERRFKIELPSALEVTIFLMIFAGEILGEINNFFAIFTNFDSMLHTLTGFLAASVGFSLVYLLNETTEKVNLSPFFISLVAFCFSMTIGVVWEFFEYGMDNIMGWDMQKDTIVSDINTVELDEKKLNTIVSINDIETTSIKTKDGKETVISGYLDIGLNDTMQDLFVNFIGAFIYSIFGYLYLKNEDKYKVAGKFLVTKKNN